MWIFFVIYRMKIEKQESVCICILSLFVCTWNSSRVLSKEAGKANLSLSAVTCTCICPMYLLFIWNKSWPFIQKGCLIFFLLSTSFNYTCKDFVFVIFIRVRFIYFMMNQFIDILHWKMVIWAQESRNFFFSQQV